MPRLPAVAVRGADATDPGAGGVRAADVVVVVTAAQMLDLAIRAIIAFGGSETALRRGACKVPLSFSTAGTLTGATRSLPQRSHHTHRAPASVSAV